MNRVLLEVAKAIDSGVISAELALIVLSFIVEKKTKIGQDENVALAVSIRRALADLIGVRDAEARRQHRVRNAETSEDLVLGEIAAVDDGESVGGGKVLIPQNG